VKNNLYDSMQVKKVPAIYQIELSSVCSLQCPGCLRTTALTREAGFLDLKLLHLMHERGDFAGTIYTELQMAGEPTLHPQLSEAIRFLKEDVGLLVGLSTHGLQMRRVSVLCALMELDALTVSVDSVDPEHYHQVRYPANFKDLTECLDSLFKVVRVRHEQRQTTPAIELQLVRVAEDAKSGNVRALQKLLDEKGWSDLCRVRVIQDCFDVMQERSQKKPLVDLCLNPFSSVSVNQKGDVCSCCYCFNLEAASINYYGNLYTQSLETIWRGVRVGLMQQSHQQGQQKDLCAKCVLKSPVLLQEGIVGNIAKWRGR